MADEVSRRFSEAALIHGRASTTALDQSVTIVPVSVVKGLELDGVVVVEPADIVEAEIQGMRSLYVALTRATQRLTVVHARPLPDAML
jgi:DNA helicase IV